MDDRENHLDNVTSLSSEDLRQQLRMLEALLFASAEPLSEELMADRLPAGVDVPALIRELQTVYAARGVNLVRVAEKWAFRTAPDLAFLLAKEVIEPRKLSRAALETLAIIAYHQPVTRAEIEDVRGVSAAKGTLDVLMETGWVRMRGRRKSPGRPVTYGTTPDFLDHFGLASIKDLPGMDELKGAGLLDAAIQGELGLPMPSDDIALRDDEDPLDEDPLDDGDETR